MGMAFHFRHKLSVFIQVLKQPGRVKKQKTFILAETARIMHLDLRDHSAKKGTMIIKCDDIGDFLVWQQVIPALQEQAERPLIFVGNKVNRPLVETYFDFADEYIWIDKSRWGDADYRDAQYQRVNACQVKIAVTTLFTRNTGLDDLLLMATRAHDRRAWDMSHHAYFSELEQEIAPATTETIKSPEKIRLEYVRNIEFVNRVFGSKLPLEFKPLFPDFGKQNRLVVVPVASAPSKCWDPFYYAEVIRQVSPLFDKIILLGGNDSSEACRVIESACQEPKIMNFAGQTSLNDMIPFIGESSLLLCPDTFALHTAVLTATDVVLLTNGTNWQRFSNYEPYISSRIKVLYPSGFKPEFEQVKLVYSRSEINAIQAEEVVKAIRDMLAKG
jgi:ADP-heptose:LPS heptosyltransferase